jgi:LDH2 family malate/lactate/ureidoglycolate dehydrogenase
MAGREIYVTAADLKGFAKRVFMAMGLPDADADVSADSLIWANLRGIDSHGVQRLAMYAGIYHSGHLNPRPEMKILKETPAVTFLNADSAMGAVSASFAMDKAIEKAKNVGIGWTLVTNTVTPLAIGFYTLQAIRAGMAGIATTFARPLMAPYGATAVGVHNGPVAFAVPAGRHRPVILDMATSAVAFGKIEVAQDKRVPIPDGWALDGNGRPTTDPNAARIMLPFGLYKGSGLAFLFECLTNIMAGDPLCAPWLLNKRNDPRHRQSSIMAAIDISLFTDLEAYRANVDDFIDAVKGLPRADGVDEIFVPGEIEDNYNDERNVTGIPLPEGTIEKLKKISEEFKVALPF